jgi:rSAM/selenodomain-associated transferase 2
MSDHHEPSLPILSIIIPALNEEEQIGATLDALGGMPGEFEVIVVDGGSRDRTAELARSRGAILLITEPGRGRQMHAGAGVVRGETLWFLHADTRPPADAARRIAAALADPSVVGGNFEIVFGGVSRPARFLNRLYPRLRLLGLAYGDSAYFVRRSAYEQVGGFRPYPIFEDVDLLRRLRRVGRFVHLPAAVVTSSRNFEGRAFLPVFARWVALQVLYWLGVSPVRLGRHYGRAPETQRSRATDIGEGSAPGSSPR